ncbi:high frequency lysogenization protein HflD [Luteimonas terricola]|uniref:High frequency lysogenization protein HflD homolog n=1 Tax=Luteimonas terricola TaxID=645597 RepID=A0ABQ2EFD7_9GAMM|nr:high frequency lysogenization protein HflD [Luteimonas terricola]GGK05615.1 high frequency lysogenization protein HflD [Luteimonas terricola]
MSDIHDRMLALAGLAQALRQVRRVAETGQAEGTVLETALGSVFRIDADSTGEIYGGVANVRPGLMLVRDYLANKGQDPLLPKLALAVTQLERRFVQDDDIAGRVHEGILTAKIEAERLGTAHPEVLAKLGTLYADTVSQLRPRVLVQGNPHYLGQAAIVAEIRAMLLAALRSAVLWRQFGGSPWDFLLRRGAMAQAVEDLLG